MEVESYEDDSPAAARSFEDMKVEALASVTVHQLQELKARALYKLLEELHPDELQAEIDRRGA